jgi:uncharacterized membrane protein YgdD (TMEM256/DUF423 family)
MGRPRKIWITLAAISAVLSVAVGAFAAHAANDPVARELLRTGGAYQMTHALAVFACAVVEMCGAPRARLAPGVFIAGSVLFSGSLYALAFGAPRWVGAITPIGGLLFMVGWAILAWASLTIDRDTRASI